MVGYERILITMAVGTLILFPSFAGTTSAQEQGAGPAKAETTGQGSLSKGGAAEEGSEYTYQYRNTWNHRNMKKNSYGDMGANAGSGQGRGFVDENGDGINDLARDHDGDGLPNGQDPDWVKNKRDGTGNQDRGAQCVRSQYRGNKRSQ